MIKHSFFSKVVIISILTTTVVGCCMRTKLRYAGTGTAGKVIEQYRSRVDEMVPVGMDCIAAKQILPKPDNTDTRYVWVWSNASTIPKGMVSWHEMTDQMACFFIVIVDGKTATPICASAAFTPAQALKYYKDWTIEKAESYLNSSPEKGSFINNNPDHAVNSWCP